MPEGEKRLIERQVETYHELYPLMLEGDYYRIASWAENHKYDCWQVVAKDKSEALVTYVQVLAEPNCHSRKIRLKGLDPEAEYQQEDNGQRYKGALLMYGGVLMPRMEGDFASAMIRFIQIG